MAGESTANAWQSANALSVIVRRRILDYAKRLAIIAPRFTNDDTAPIRSHVHRVDRFPDLSANVTDLTEGDELTPTAITPTSVDITPATTGIAAEITDLLAGSTPNSGFEQYFSQMAGVIVEEMDDDTGALLTALNGGTAVGSTGVDLTLPDILNALVIHQTNQAVGNPFCMLHPRQAADLGLDVGGFTAAQHGAAAAGTVTTRLVDNLGNVGTNGLVGSVAGVPVYVSPRIPTVNAGADRSGALASPDAITIAKKWIAKSEQQRNALGVGTYLVVSSAYGIGETADNWGVPIESDA